MCGLVKFDFTQLAVDFLKSESAATSIEYAIIGGSLSIVILVTVGQVGSALNGIFVAVVGAFK